MQFWAHLVGDGLVTQAGLIAAWSESGLIGVEGPQLAVVADPLLAAFDGVIAEVAHLQHRGWELVHRGHETESRAAVLPRAHRELTVGAWSYVFLTADGEEVPGASLVAVVRPEGSTLGGNP